MRAGRLLVETLLQMRAAGFTLRDIEVALSLARLSSGGSLVEPLEQEILLSWCAMALLTLDSLGVPLPPDAVSSTTHQYCIAGSGFACRPA